MKKSWVIAGAVGAFAATANAQSSVTLYGSIDAGLAYVNNVAAVNSSGNVVGKSSWLQSNGLLSNTYFGLRGAEDLGGGLQTIFTLENGFSMNNGKLAEDGSIFNRQAFVGVRSENLGTVTLGRQYDSVVDYLSPLALAGAGTGVNLAAHPFDNDNIGSSFSTKNTIKYESANFSGFHFGGMYGFSNQAGAFADGRVWSLGAGYANGPFTISAAYLQVNSNNAKGAASADSTATGNVSVDLHRVYGIGAGYAFDRGTVGALWTHTQENGLVGMPLDARIDNFELNGTFGLTPQLAFVGAYTYSYGKVKAAGAGAGSGSPRWDSVTLGADYSLSKRTDTYIAGVYQHAGGNLFNGVPGIPGTTVANVTSIAGMIDPSSTANQVAIAVGIRHRF